MDNFRRNNPNQRRPSRGIDGFITGPTPVKKVPGVGNQSRNLASGKIGNFNSVDGFRPSGRNPLYKQPANNLGRQPRRDHTGRIDLNLPEATPHKRKHPKQWRKVALKFSSILVILTIVLTGYLLGKGYLKARQIFKGGGGAAALQENVDPSKLRGEGDGRVNVLMLGKGGEGHEGADLTDTLVIASINPVQKEAALLSLPRDLYVKTPDGHTKINAVYANAKNASLAKTSTRDSSRAQKAEEAGIKAVEDVIQQKIGIPIHYNIMVDFAGFKEAINTVGGVEVNVPKELTVSEHMMIAGYGPYYLNVGTGQQQFDGHRALAFARSRQTSARGAFDRSQRQRMILLALKDKVISAGTYGNPFKINQLLNNFGKHVEANMTTDEVMRLYDIGKEINSSSIASVDLVTAPNNYLTTANIGGLSVVIPKAGIDNYSEVQNFIRNRLKDGFIAQENATIMVLNGTNISGLAGRTATDLKSYGYNISQTADAPTKGYGQTIIVDMRNGAKKYTRHYLEGRFSVSAVNSLPDKSIVPGNADFVIIMGQNEVSRLDR